MLKQLYDNWNDKAYSWCVFVDFSRAFESIDHSILLEKLKLYGLDTIPLTFMENYMSCRRQITTVNGHNSKQEAVTYGTAQGSILGPLIFIMYVNDIFDSLDQDNSVFMYADDTLLISKAETIEEITAKAEKTGKHVNLVSS